MSLYNFLITILKTNSMNSSAVFAIEMKARAKQFSLRIIKLFQSLPKTEEAKILGRQLLRSATSVGAN